MDKKAYFTTGDVAHLLDISRATVSRKFDDGILSGNKNPITGERLISRESLIAFMKQYNLSLMGLEVKEEAADTAPPNPRGMLHILVGSPDEQLRALVERTFCDDDRITVDMVASGYDSLIKCSQSPPDLFIIDEELTDISCVDAVSSLKRMEAQREMKILCCLKTYNPDKVKQIGADDYLAKDRLEGADIARKTALLGFLFGSITGDITTLKKYEEEYYRTSKPVSIGILTNKVMNDFNNILTSIYGNISLAKMLTDPSDEIYDLLTDAETASRLAKDLIAQLRTSTTSSDPIKKPTALAGLIAETAAFALRKSNSVFAFTPPEDLWPVNIDKEQINQALYNLITNADQAMPGGGRITVTAENLTVSATDPLPLTPGRYVKVSITDKGVGIPREYFKKIFEEFFTTKPKECGLGLTRTISIIRKHEGHIEVDSRVGVGTTFSVYLPATSENPRKEPKQAPQSPDSTAHILVMDDEPAVRKVVERMIEHLGHTSVMVTDGADAVTAYREAKESGDPFDVVIMDFTVPNGMGGIEAMEQIRAVDPAVSAVLSTGNLNEPVVSEYRTYGFKNVIPKPFEMRQLAEVLADLLGGRHGE